MTTDTATREALIKAGLWTKPPRPEPPPRPAPFRNPLEMSNEEVVSEIMQLRFDVAYINTQLATDQQEGFQNGPDWRRRAGKARSFKNARLVQLTAVAATRRLPEGLPDLARDEAIKRERAERHKRDLEEQHQEKLRRNRELAEVAKEKAERQKREHEAQHQEKLRRIREHVEAHRGADQNGLTEEAMFVKAAYRLYSKDACDQIWKRARELFPDHPAWAKLDKKS